MMDGRPPLLDESGSGTPLKDPRGKKVRILHLLDSFDTGGSETQAVQLLGLLQQTGKFEIYVACLRDQGPLKPKLIEMGFTDIPEFRLRSFYGPHAARQLLRFVRHLRSLKIELIHTHDFYANVFGMTGAKLAGVRCRIASRRDMGGRASHKKFIERLAFRGADKVLVNCGAVAKRLQQEGVTGKRIVVVYNGVDTGKIAPAERSGDPDDKFGLQAGKRVVALVANLRSPVKNHAMFLRVAQRVLAECKDVQFVAAGEGGLMPAMKEMAQELGIEESVKFIGRCDDTAALLNRSDICVLTSWTEGFSNAILEYLSAGRPVVVTQVGGAAEMVEDGVNGYLVKSDDDEQMAAKILKLLGDPSQAKVMGERGRDAAFQQFSLRAQLENTIELYASLGVGQT